MQAMSTKRKSLQLLKDIVMQAGQEGAEQLQLSAVECALVFPPALATLTAPAASNNANTSCTTKNINDPRYPNIRYAATTSTLHVKFMA